MVNMSTGNINYVLDQHQLSVMVNLSTGINNYVLDQHQLQKKYINNY